MAVKRRSLASSRCHGPAMLGIHGNPENWIDMDWWPFPKMENPWKIQQRLTMDTMAHLMDQVNNIFSHTPSSSTSNERNPFRGQLQESEIQWCRIWVWVNSEVVSPWDPHLLVEFNSEAVYWGFNSILHPLTSQFLVIKTQHNPIFGGRYRVPNSEPPPWCQGTHSPNFDAPAPFASVGSISSKHSSSKKRLQMGKNVIACQRCLKIQD